jgi:hypothetical protein
MSRHSASPAVHHHQALLSRSLLAAATVALALSIGCSDRRLVPIEGEEIPEYDNLVDIDASFCTRRAEEVAFPVKLLLVLDGSGSLQFTDQSGTRRAAVRDLMSSLAPQPDVYVATMVFGSNIYVDPQIAPGAPTFIPASDWVEPGFLGTADVTTNYQGALSAIRSHLLMDMLNSDAAELARTKYVVIFFSDGAPLPQCCIPAEESVGAVGESPFGCPVEPWQTNPAAGDRYCEGIREIELCNLAEWLDNFRMQQGVPGAAPNYGDGTLGALEDLEPGNNYNRLYQIEDLVLELVELGEDFGVGEFRMHTALLFDDTLPDAIKAEIRASRCRSENLLARMAELGNGVFVDFENSGEIDFLSFNFTSLRRGYSLLASYAHNASALPTTDTAYDGFWPDTDHDGLSDAEEFKIGTHPSVSDSDSLYDRPAVGVQQAADPLPRDQWGDGYSDRVEETLRSVGYDPQFQAYPVTACPDFDPQGIDRFDLDMDGLNGCEEALFGSDVEIADTDGDALPDGLEVRLGLDPIVHEGARDDDFDGVENFKEVRRGSDPHVADQDVREGLAYRYELLEDGLTDDGRQCYVSRISDVRLVTTEPMIEGGRRGYNEIYVWLSEVPTDNPSGNTELRFACYRAQYIEPTFKDPPQGQITIREEDFWDLSDPEHIALLQDPDTDPCVGRPLR